MTVLKWNRLPNKNLKGSGGLKIFIFKSLVSSWQKAAGDNICMQGMSRGIKRCLSWNRILKMSKHQKWLNFGHLVECPGWIWECTKTTGIAPWPKWLDVHLISAWPTVGAAKEEWPACPNNGMSGIPSARRSREQMVRITPYSARMEQAREEGRSSPPQTSPCFFLFPPALQAWHLSQSHLQLL